MDYYIEALSYLDYAKTILKTKAMENGEFYENRDYVSVAAYKAWNGLLLALQGKMKREGVEISEIDVKDISVYKDFLLKNNKFLPQYFVSSYNILYMGGFYEKDLSISFTDTGLEYARKIISWCK